MRKGKIKNAECCIFKCLILWYLKLTLGLKSYKRRSEFLYLNGPICQIHVIMAILNNFSTAGKTRICWEYYLMAVNYADAIM